MKSSLHWTVLFFQFFLLSGAQPDEDEEAIEFACQGEYEKALELFTLQLEDNEDDPIANYFVGLCYFFLGKPDDAREYLVRSIENNAPFPEAYYWTAQSFSAVEDMNRTVMYLKIGLEKFPQNKKLIELQNQVDGIDRDQKVTNQPGINEKNN
jgi:tetratricopeptide (TPR) repeat protein